MITPMKSLSKRHRGFTLLEVLVALTIFAICATTLLRQSGETARHSHALETRTFANWIAENKLEAIRLEQQDNQQSNQMTILTSRTTEDVEFTNRHWSVSTTIHPTSDESLYRIEVSVQATDTGDSSPIITLSSFLGVH